MMFHVSHLWIAAAATFGLVVNVTDAQVVSEEPGEKAEPACPSPLSYSHSRLGGSPFGDKLRGKIEETL